MKFNWRLQLVLVIQRTHEIKIWIVQKLIGILCSVFRVALVANYVKEKNLVQLELIPSYLLKLRKQEMAMMEMMKSMQGKGDDFTKEIVDKPRSDETV